MKDIHSIKTIGQLKASGYKSRSVKEEMRENLISSLRNNVNVFGEVKGYEDTVIPQLQTAILSKHNIILLGLRGQAKTRIARLMLKLLDEFIPVITGTDLNDDPFHPMSASALDLIAKMGDETPISWIQRDERYTEKLATPDVSVADLIGDLDPVKAATLKLSYADERVIHYGLIPRAHRGIFVINELPDLQARIQVALFNILQEGDIQIRGFKIRLPLDVQFVFTANPEDYTSRGSIITPLKDRIDSQILTHYPRNPVISAEITHQEAKLANEQRKAIKISELLKELVEDIAFQARESEYIDQKSGVSARLSISAFESLHSAAERRMLVNNEKSTQIRISDLYSVITAITGKVELVYEGELEGISNVAYYLIGKVIRKKFEDVFPSPEKVKKAKNGNPYSQIVSWFTDGNELDILQDISDKEYAKQLSAVPGLQDLVDKIPNLTVEENLIYMEFALHGLAEFSQLSKLRLDKGVQFKDLMSSMFDMGKGLSDEEDDSLF